MTPSERLQRDQKRAHDAMQKAGREDTLARYEQEKRRGRYLRSFLRFEKAFAWVKENARSGGPYHGRDLLAVSVIVDDPTLDARTSMTFVPTGAAIWEEETWKAIKPELYEEFFYCRHERLDEDGICRDCGTDRRGL